MNALPDSPPSGPRARLAAGALAALTLAFAFLSASYPIRDPELWTHLALGRALVTGEYRFGTDPLSYTTAGVYWANHAWLFDLGLYLVFQNLGPVALALLKPLAVAVLVGTWLLSRRSGSNLSLPAVGAVVGVIALAPKLALQPMLASTVLFAVTVGLLTRHVDPKRPADRRVWLLVPLFVLWVNLDSWFLLGPLAVFLFWAGERLSGAGERRLPSQLLGACVIACVLSPHHVFAFQLPIELSPGVLASGLRDDPRFARFFQRGYAGLFDNPDWYARIPAAALVGLFGAGLVSCFLCPKARADGRLFVWLLGAALGAWNARLIPLFVAVAVPVLVLNFQDVGVRAAAEPRVRWRRVAVGALVGAAGVGLLGFAWLGGPLGVRPDRRRVAWEVQPDAGLQRGAETRAEWRRNGQLTDSDRVFHLHPDSAGYAHWFAPGERCFLDHRLALFARVAPEYREIGRGLTPSTGIAKLPSTHGITCVVVHDPDVSRLQGVLSRLWHPTVGCVLLDLSGREAALGLRERSRAGAPFDRWRLDLDARAFGPADPPVSAPRAVAAPTAWEPLMRLPRLRPADADTAALLLQYADDQVAALAPEVARGQAAVAVASLVAEAPAFTHPFALGMRLDQTALFMPPLDSAPPAAALLALRAARRAVADAPDDPLAHLRMGQAYLALTYTTRESLWADRCRPLAQLRHVQAACALERAVALAPDLEPAHALLVRVYGQRGMTDAVLYHMREQVRILDKSGAGDRLRRLRDELNGLEAAVQDRRNRFALRTQGLGNAPFNRANIALQLGLPRTALDEVLLPSTVVLFGLEGARLEVELLLMLGRPDRARQELDDEQFRQNQDRLGAVEMPGDGSANRPMVYRLPAYAWNRFLLAAADGDYPQADESLRVVMARLGEERDAREQGARMFVARAAATEVGLGLRPELGRLHAVVGGDPSEIIRLSDRMNLTSRQVEADMRCLAGLLALEAGRTTAAAEHFRAALALAGASDLGFASEPACRAYLGRLQNAGGR